MRRAFILFTLVGFVAMCLACGEISHRPKNEGEAQAAKVDDEPTNKPGFKGAANSASSSGDKATPSKNHNVSGYTTKNGTQVQPYRRR